MCRVLTTRLSFYYYVLWRPTTSEKIKRKLEEETKKKEMERVGMGLVLVVYLCSLSTTLVGHALTKQQTVTSNRPM